MRVLAAVWSFWRRASVKLPSKFILNLEPANTLYSETHDIDRRMRDLIIYAKATRIQWQTLENMGLYRLAARTEIKLLDSIITEVANIRSLLFLMPQRSCDCSNAHLTTLFAVKMGFWHIAQLYYSGAEDSHGRVELFLSAQRTGCVLCERPSDRPIYLSSSLRFEGALSEPRALDGLQD